MMYSPQVSLAHYAGKAYRSMERWNSYWHQLAMVRSVHPANLLEIGLGEGIVARELIRTGVSVVTVDIAEDLQPDIVGSVTALPFEDNSFDGVLAAEILEHIRFEDVPTALGEIARVTRGHAVIALPHPGYVFSCIIKLPLLPRIELFFQIPFFWKKHVFNGEHYWELGKRGYSVQRFVDCAHDAGLQLIRKEGYADDPAHRFFLFEKIVAG